MYFSTSQCLCLFLRFSIIVLTFGSKPQGRNHTFSLTVRTNEKWHFPRAPDSIKFPCFMPPEHSWFFKKLMSFSWLVWTRVLAYCTCPVHYCAQSSRTAPLPSKGGMNNWRWIDEEGRCWENHGCLVHQSQTFQKHSSLPFLDLLVN